jgi:DNA-directed RNA polymerase subunit K/omega
MEKEEFKFTKYEVARIVGARALQISMNAPILMNISKEKLEEMNYDPIKIAELEFSSGILPISIKRPMPKREEEENEEEVEVVKEEEAIPGEVKPEKATEEEMAETEDEEEETKEEEAIEEAE